MQITIHSDFYVDVIHPGGVITLEYDEAADLAEALRAEPHREQEFAARIVEAE